ncbi:MAG: GyrI-like domain-containing protein [Formosimonas sp.]
MIFPIVHIDSFQVAGLPIRTTNAVEQSPNGKIPQLWQDFFAQDLFGIDERIAGTPAYGAYVNYESDDQGAYDVIAGVKVNAAPNTHLQTVKIEAGDYMVFKTTGAMPQRIIDGWQAVWAYFASSNATHERTYSTDFEQYVDEDDVAIYIAVKARA